ncbi:MAG: ABC transporter permease [Verrucomicrobiaceae bacterium]|nr:ABC transporter permease [Verrucomicrobiaceae bacterium]
MRAFRAILWKEWVSLRPFALLLLALFVFGLFLVQATEYFDVYPFWANTIGNLGSVVAMTFILCAVVSLGLMVREKDEGTLLYLDGLPLSRFSIYLAKWLVAVALVSAVNLLWTLESIVYDLLSRGSASPPVPWRSIGVFAVLELFLGVYFITLLVAFSFLRRWTLVAIGAVFWILLGLRSLQAPYAELLDPSSLLVAPAEIDDRWEWPRLQLLVMGVIALIAWIVGYILFSFRQGSASAFSRRLRETCWGKLAGGCAVVLIVVIWLGIFVTVSWEDSVETARAEAAAPASPVDRAKEIVTTESERFLFVYRREIQHRVETLEAKADAIHETVADFLEMPEEDRGDRITVDLSSPLAAHNAGQAYWKKIRMTLPPGDEDNPDPGDKEGVAILGHEITHVFLDQITDGRLGESFDAARWFHEGLASYVEFRFFRDDSGATAYRRWIALAAQWEEVEFSEMVHNETFSTKRDPFLAYPAGYLWVDSLVRVYGDDAPAKLLRALGRREGPRKLRGLALWRDACLAADFDLERVRSDFRRQLADLREEYADASQAFPEITAGDAFRRGDKIVIHPEFPDGWKSHLPDGAEILCRVRPRADARPTEWRYSGLGEEESFSVPAISFLKPAIGFQIGWKMEADSRFPVFGEWVNVTVSE